MERSALPNVLFSSDDQLDEPKIRTAIVPEALSSSLCLRLHSSIPSVWSEGETFCGNCVNLWPKRDFQSKIRKNRMLNPLRFIHLYPRWRGGGILYHSQPSISESLNTSIHTFLPMSVHSFRTIGSVVFVILWVIFILLFKLSSRCDKGIFSVW